MEINGSLSKLLAVERASLIAAGKRLTFKAGAVILEQGGEREEAIYVVEGGLVRIERQLRLRASYRLSETENRVERRRDLADDEPTQLVIARLGPGSIFGEMSFLVRSPGNTSIVAEADSGIVFVDRPGVDRLMNADPDFAGRFYHSLAVTLTRRIRATNKLVV